MTGRSLAARVRAASHDSLIATAGAQLHAAATRSWTPRHDRGTFDHETAWVSQEFATTWIGRVVAATSEAVARAWREAVARQAMETVFGSVRALTPAARIRLIGIWVTTATLTDLVLTPFDPRPASVVRWILWAAVFVLGAFSMLRPAATAAALTDWRARRSWSRQKFSG